MISPINVAAVPLYPILFNNSSVPVFFEISWNLVILANLTIIQRIVLPIINPKITNTTAIVI